ncbi:MAG: nucleotidyltransferase domain-containing protein [Desulfobacterota bacterium]|nr:nucleotidyltransferase domain-containing protein [Thermodesulfobacteriota bacterium]
MTAHAAILAASRPAVSVLDFPREKIISFLSEKLQSAGLREAYIIGSFAENRCRAWSDIDLIIVRETTRPFIERAQDFLNLYDLGIPLDILVYTPEEFSHLLQSSNGFWHGVRKNRLRIL